MRDRSPRFSPGWWLVPIVLMGAAGWAVLISALWSLLT